MKPLSLLEPNDVAGLRGVVFDLDDTLLDHGRLTRVAYDALDDLAGSGLMLIGCTGRPSGWAEVMSRLWPTRAVVAENGALAWCREARGIVCRDTVSTLERSRRRALLEDAVAAILALGLTLADDNHHRLTDVAFDIGEHVTVPEEVIEAACRSIRARGFRVFRSSIHLHMTLDAHDKATGTLALLASFGIDPTSARNGFAYVGDSGNDAAAFAAFRLTFGVANVRAHLRALSVPPRFVSPSARGEGFAQIAAALARHSAGASLKEGVA